MFSTRTKIVIAIAWMLFTLLMQMVAVQDFIRDGGTELWKPILWETSSAVTGLGLWLIMRYLTQPYDDALLATPWRWFALQVACLPLLGLCFVPITFGIRHGVYYLMGQTYTHAAWPQLYLYESMRLAIFMGLFTVILFGMLSYFSLVNEKLKADQAQALHRQAQLQRLTQQMQPHFLFNALNTISSLMHSDIDKADATLIQLADVLRATLDASEQATQSLQDELRIARGYASVMAERFSDRVAIAWQIEDDTLSCQVPVMSLQPLLENIFKHTVERSRQFTHINVLARREGGQLVLRLSDDVGTLAMPEAATSAVSNNTGIGVRNLRQRLAMLYGDDASFSLSALPGSGVQAEMRLPCAC
ncbi:MAG: histidine kinase [Burkholderiales bacterium]|nr:histidine kinase [Burkholderiales bacterium]